MCIRASAKYEDVNGDGVIDENDIVYLGNSNPTLTGGLNFTLRYKKLSLVAALHLSLIHIS